MEPNVQTFWYDPLIAVIMATYHESGREFSDQVQELWEKTLEKLDPERAALAIRRAVMECENGPVRVSTVAQKHAELIAPAPSPSDAWGEVADKMSRARPAPLSHALIAETVADMGGLAALWHEYGYADKVTSLSVIRAQFQKAYEGNRERARKEIASAVQEGGVNHARALFPQWFAPYEAYRLMGRALPETRAELRAIEERAQAQTPAPDMDAVPLPENVRTLFDKIRNRPVTEPAPDVDAARLEGRRAIEESERLQLLYGCAAYTSARARMPQDVRTQGAGRRVEWIRGILEADARNAARNAQGATGGEQGGNGGGGSDGPAQTPQSAAPRRTRALPRSGVYVGV